jgi:hypothetical protein
MNDGEKGNVDPATTGWQPDVTEFDEAQNCGNNSRPHLIPQGLSQ